MLEACLGGIPAQFCLGFGGVAPQVDYIGWTVEVLTYAYQNFSYQALGCTAAYSYAGTGLIEALALKLEFYASVLECVVGKLSY